MAAVACPRIRALGARRGRAHAASGRSPPALGCVHESQRNCLRRVGSRLRDDESESAGTLVGGRGASSRLPLSPVRS
jgi:hypothetical protein